MAKNFAYHVGQFGSVVAPLPVAANAKSGDLVLIGTAGLWGIALTDRATAGLGGNLDKGEAAPGLKDTEASVLLPNVLYKLNAVSSVAAIARFAKVYYNPATKVYNTTAAGNIFVGYSADDVTAINQLFQIFVSGN